jgi:radical SAM protein with 4Fe4S-binding SPASM domain
MKSKGLTLKSGTVRLSAGIRLREEYFGGLIYNTATGDTLEVDAEAYRLLQWLRETGSADVRAISRQKQAGDVLKLLIGMGVVEAAPENEAGAVYQPRTHQTFSQTQRRQILSAPETVHLAVTWRCGEACPDCYARRHKSENGLDNELNTEETLRIIDAIAEAGVFQLAIGGGEPFARQDIVDIVKFAANSGLTTHMTTGRYALEPHEAQVFQYIKSLHIGIRSEELISGGEETAAKLCALVDAAYDAGVGTGANLIMTRFTLQHLREIVETLLRCGFERLIFLRYKPIDDQERWNAENPSRDDLMAFERWLLWAKNQLAGIMIRVDCAATHMMRLLKPSDAARAGIRGCVAGERIVSVAPDGSVYPCSQLVGQAFRAGRLTEESFVKLWRESEVLDRYRLFRQSESYADSVCGQCGAGSFCGGCRVFAEDSLGGEMFCPIGRINGG